MGQALTKDEVFDLLVEEILSQQLGPGEPLSERRLAERFGLSRTPIREVLLKLEAEQLVDLYPHQGAFVKRLSPKDVRDLFELRFTLEPFAADLAARYRPTDEVIALKAQVASVTGVSDPVDPVKLVKLGEYLHDSVARWSKNDLLIDVYLVLRRRTRLVRTMTRTRPDIELQSLQEHAAILNAISDGNSIAAKKAMEHHLERSSSEFLASFFPRETNHLSPGGVDDQYMGQRH